MSAAVKKKRAKSYNDVFWKEIVAEGAVVKVDLVEGLFGQLHHVTLVVAAVFVLADHLLSDGELIHGRFISLFVEKYQSIVTFVPLVYCAAGSRGHRWMMATNADGYDCWTLSFSETLK